VDYPALWAFSNVAEYLTKHDAPGLVLVMGNDYAGNAGISWDRYRGADCEGRMKSHFAHPSGNGRFAFGFGVDTREELYEFIVRFVEAARQGPRPVVPVFVGIESQQMLIESQQMLKIRGERFVGSGRVVKCRPESRQKPLGRSLYDGAVPYGGSRLHLTTRE
jgi:hypothetical protein